MLKATCEATPFEYSSGTSIKISRVCKSKIITWWVCPLQKTFCVLQRQPLIPVYNFLPKGVQGQPQTTDRRKPALSQKTMIASSFFSSTKYFSASAAILVT
jgi:hypothetical protein